MTTKDKLTHSIITITPQMAQTWLDESKFENRRIENSRIKKLVSDIKKDKWVFDGTPIRFNGGGDILDGQHRLMAIVRAQKPVKSLVIRGLETTSKNTIDTGKVRTIGDLLHFNGQLNTTTLAAAARLSLGYDECKGDLGQWSKTVAHNTSNQEIIEECQKNHKLVKATQAIMNLHYVRKICGSGTAALCYYLFMKSSAQHLADSFFTSLENGNNLTEDSAILVLRNTLSIRDTKRQISGRRRSAYNVALFIKAWNAWRSNATVQVLRYGFDEEYPKIGAEK